MLTLDHPTTETTWDAPGPGPWRQDRAHLSASISPMLQAAYPDGINRGFAETFAAWGIVLDGVRWTCVNGFPYIQLVPFDAPGPDGPRTPEYLGSEIGRRTAVAAAAFENRIWRDTLRRRDAEIKPAAIAAHRALANVDLGALDTAGLRAHLHQCIKHLDAMWFQHHRFNGMAMIPVGDFVLHAAA